MANDNIEIRKNVNFVPKIVSNCGSNQLFQIALSWNIECYLILLILMKKKNNELIHCLITIQNTYKVFQNGLHSILHLQLFRLLNWDKKRTLGERRIVVAEAANVLQLNEFFCDILERATNTYKHSAILCKCSVVLVCAEQSSVQ